MNETEYPAKGFPFVCPECGLVIDWDDIEFVECPRCGYFGFYEEFERQWTLVHPVM